MGSIFNHRPPTRGLLEERRPYMAYINQVTLMGHLTADPELKTTPAGDSVATFSVAVNSKLKSGESRAEFFDVEIWKGWATNLCKTAKKGALVLLTGRL